MKLIKSISFIFVAGFIFVSCNKQKDIVEKPSVKNESVIAKTGDTPNTPIEIINWDEALSAVFYSESYQGYGKRFVLMPPEKHMSEFPNLGHSGEKEFFEFSNTSSPINISMKDIGRYKHIRGFSQYYEVIKELDPYSLKETETETLSKLNAAHSDYIKEYNRYLNTLFMFRSDLLDVHENNYDLDNQVIQLLLNFSKPFISPKRRPGAMDVASEKIFAAFNKQGFKAQEEGDTGIFVWDRGYMLPLSIDLAKKYFDHLAGKPGERIGSYSIKYWVKPTRGKIKGIRLSITGMQLERVEFIFYGKTGFHVIMSKFGRNRDPIITIEEFN